MREENNTDTLKEKLEIALKALEFYENDGNYYMYCTYGNTNVQKDNGKTAKEALRRIKCLSQI